MRFSKRILFGITCLILSLNAGANGDPVEGREKAKVCLTCHRIGNIVNGADTPIISGQYEDYLIQALISYRTGARSNPIMNGFAANLSNEDIKDIAAFYSELDSQLFTPTN